MCLKQIPVILLLASGLLAAAAPKPVELGAERRVSLNQDWRFFLGEAPGAEKPAFDDSSWKALELPHDWAIWGPFDAKINPHEGALPYFGTGWYRKSFTLSESAKAKRLTVEFDGAMSNSTVWINGVELGGRPNGYVGFSFDLTPHLRFGGAANVLAVRLMPEEKSSRWYPGAGIYRNVWLEATAPLHVARWGTYVTTPKVTDAEATVEVKTEIENHGKAAARITLETSIIDAAGRTVARDSHEQALEAGASAMVDARAVIARPQRWDIERPYLYTLASEVKQDGRTVDRYVTPFGIRTIEFNREKGFLLNGRHVKMRGVCNHHDLGALGAAVNRRATERQLEIMQSMGVNAIRTSHNPPSPELLELCDRMGLLVMDESFDMWEMPKTKNGYSKYFKQWADRDLRDQILRDRNHPSVVMWSIGNEIPEQNRSDGWKIAKHLTEICHQFDPTRPTTAAFNIPAGAIKNELAANVDVPGLNYKPWLYENTLKEHPNWVLVGTETASTVSSRGVYHLPIEKYDKHPSLQLTSYDIIAPPWAYAPDPELEKQEEMPQLAGEFVWTGFDYLGEPTPFHMRAESKGDWPSRSSYFGIVDLAGFPKDRYYLYQSVWTAKPMVHVLPHWNWPGREGQPIPVMAYSNAEQVELFLNGKSLGKKTVRGEPVEIPVGPNISETRKYSTKLRLLWQVPYTPGTLRAVAYKQGRQVAVDEVRTAGAPARVSIRPDRAAIRADGEDLSFLTVRIEDKDGNLCPEADNLVEFQVEGAGRLEAVDNGNAATIESFQADRRKAFSGMALLIVRSDRTRAGAIRITAASSGLAAATTTVTTAR